ncbi:MAG: hypothetical protein M1825_004508 [Sarcosagium campestre]|nr:MAG: hypothetical protein M1825_004508 [Sarcosagium campestre]
MSYADIAAKGPKQTPEELTAITPTLYSRAPAPPQIEHTDESESLIDVDSKSVHSVPSDYLSQSVKTDTQAERLEREAEDQEREAEAEYKKAKKEGKAKAGQAKAEARKATSSARDSLSRASKDFRDNSDNPVVLGNAVLAAVLGVGLGYGAYRKHVTGELNWKVAGAWSGVVGLIAVGDYYVSQYLFQNKFPKK